MEIEAPERLVQPSTAPSRSVKDNVTLRAIEAALFAAPLAVAVVMGYRQRWVAEDAFITLRVVDNLLAGHGPVFNIGERVEVYTHPLWLLLLTLAGLLGARPEQAAIYLGLGLAVAGLVFAQLAAARLFRALVQPPAVGRALMAPAGALAFVAIPVVWDFLTSGLETGLSFAWLGFSFWSLARRATGAGGLARWSRLPLFEALVFGLGPLVRPDLGLYALAFLLALVIVEGRGAGRRKRLVGAFWLLLSFGSVVGLYQIFRMGYFAALVPNTALAKEAGSAEWERGWAYFIDLIGTYHLWIPLAVALGGTLYLLLTTWARERALALVVAAPVVAALLHALYIIRIGGDFMHGRLLLPALFAFLLPVAAVPVPLPGIERRPAAAGWAALGVVGVWALACGFLFRWSPDAEAIRNGIPQGIVNERQFFVEQTGNAHPQSVDDYRGLDFEWVEHGEAMRALAATYPRSVLTNYGNHPLSEEFDQRIALVVWARSIGVQSHAAGDHVRLVDLHGLGDPLASRMKLAEGERPGHAKQLPQIWIHARYADLDAIGPLPADLQAAADVLACGDVDELLAAVEEPMTAARFVENLALSWSLTDLRIDPNPFVAREELCYPATATPAP